VKFTTTCVGLFAFALAGCSITSEHKWGEGVTLTPGWVKFKHAAINALKDPGTWVPAAGAAFVLASGRDEELTQAALRENPVYGSKKEAADTSDEHSLLLDKIWIATMFAADSGEQEWLRNKTTGVAAQVLMMNSAHWTTNILKEAIWRREPDPDLKHVEHEGFPSNHSLPPFAQVGLIRRNLRYTSASNAAQSVLITTSYLLATSSAYGRVEAGLHHYSDQLAGAALGNFFGLTVYDTFMEEERDWQLLLYPTPDLRGGMALFSAPLP
jgi:hypothetical protein